MIVKSALRAAMAIVVLSLFSSHVQANDRTDKKGQKRTFSAHRVAESPKIDGVLNDLTWNENGPKYTFSQWEPDNGADASFETQVQVHYDDNAIYIQARMFDPEPDKIQRELGLRDDDERNSDLFGLVFDTYNKGQNAFVLGVTAAGVQFDSYVVNDNWDYNWDAVWKSAVVIDDNGWVVEMEIPYYAIRFPKQEVQTWGVNFYRKVQRKREESFWNHVDKSIQGMVNQSGTLEGIEGVEPPLRLAFLPYASVVHSRDQASGENSTKLNGGMDLKYGINEAFTLDMSLIPDFSQVQSDDQVLNLSAFEIQFDERRPFFTEGTELFNKGGLFYSRRVGRSLRGYRGEEKKTEYDIEVSTPTTAPLVNATKISGRTKKGMGVGVFNGITRRTYAELLTPIDIDDYTLDEDGNRKYANDNMKPYEILVDPLTNYNVFVVDQNLKNNSNIALINTNVSRTDGFENVNFTATDFQFYDKSITYTVSGNGAIGYSAPKNGAGAKVKFDKGYKYNLFLGKVSGKWQFRVQRNVESDEYNPNDLGFNQAPNEVYHWGQISYNVFNPVWILNNWSMRLNLNHNQLYKHPVDGERKFADFNVNLNFNTTFKNFWEFGTYGGINTPQNRYFEAQDFETMPVFKRPDSFFMGAWIGTDSRKPFYVNFDKGIWHMPEWGAHDHWHWLSTRYRVNNKLSFEYQMGYTREYNGRGYLNGQVSDSVRTAHNLGDKVVFGNRDIKSLEQVVGVNYTFNSKMGLNVRLRHYWSTVSYSEYYTLENDGSITSIAYEGTMAGEGQPIHNLNYNFFSLNLNYSWQIAPGSFLTFNWQNILEDVDDTVYEHYDRNFDKMRKSPNGGESNSFSIKLTYFIDYLTLRNSIRKRS